ncbi:MAG: PorP/SprF family type IX secretion system membrane protein [Bacteroidetes bacterium]|nr:PorP/SprF family type IX secretion system membrane protein [Bacteroidota bacterium]
MKRFITTLILFIWGIPFSIQKAAAQGMHFSQFYNAPLLLNPANTALMSENDYRIGVNYRNQWAAVPVPYRTFSAYADMQALRNRNQTNWLGVGLSFWNDKAGDGNLSLSRAEISIAYHIQMGQSAMISVGGSAANIQRTVDYSKLTFDKQWDGFHFDPAKTSGEQGNIARTSLFDVGAGVNFAYFPNENTYLKIGVGMAHLTQPKESFYGQENRLGMRPTVNIDLLVKLSTSVTLNPSIYYTRQKDASELLYGTLFEVSLSNNQQTASALILGAFHRWNEAIVGVGGLQYGKVKLISSYDFTISTLSNANKGRGAFELSIIYTGLYNQNSGMRRTLNCPRF